MNPEISLQDQFAPEGTCFGCGPKNQKGLRIKSFVAGNEVIATWKSEPHHEAFPGMLNGGIIGALLDCHSNWTAAWYLMEKRHEKQPPCTVTADFAVKLLRPTPSHANIELKAVVLDATDDKVKTEAQLMADGKVCATCHGTFVAVKPGHPAYNRW